MDDLLFLITGKFILIYLESTKKTWQSGLVDRILDFIFILTVIFWWRGELKQLLRVKWCQW